jgi:hypothetical protein
MSFVPFVDFTHDSVASIPAVKGTLVALYATGSATIVATAADIAKYKNAGAGVVMIDQSEGLGMFASGQADVADVESGAATPESAAAAVAQRQAHGWQSTLYVSYNSLSALSAAILNKTGVVFGVADYSWSESEAETLMGQNPNWAYVQYGDPESNPTTLVPGTNVTLKQCNADIDVAQASWANQFLPPPPPAPDPPTYGPPAACEGAYRWVMRTDKSLADFAAFRGSTVLGLLKISALKLNAKNYAALNAYVQGPGVNAPMPDGLIVYTVNA